MKHITRFGLLDSYTSYKESASFPSHNVSYVDGNGLVYFKGPRAKHYIAYEDTQAGNIVVCVDGDYKYLDANDVDDTDTLVGVVVAPPNLMPDAKMRVMSLVNMSTQTPNVGTASYDGVTNTDSGNTLIWGASTSESLVKDPESGSGGAHYGLWHWTATYGDTGWFHAGALACDVQSGYHNSVGKRCHDPAGFDADASTKVDEYPESGAYAMML